jgi:LuxR family maltose regulon positive regulatory protein
VLELVSLGMTNRAIAKRLLLSESTVRAHVRSISQKLGSQNRVQAVARATSLGMIGPGTAQSN